MSAREAPSTRSHLTPLRSPAHGRYWYSGAGAVHWSVSACGDKLQPAVRVSGGVGALGLVRGKALAGLAGDREARAGPGHDDRGGAGDEGQSPEGL